jgi:hypothetical protein
MTTAELALWADYYAVEPWGLADRAIESFGQKREAAQSAEDVERMFERGLGR